MTYRDDVEAVYQRAAALQREVDRLQAELAAERAPPPPPVEQVDVPDHLRDRTRPVVPPAPPPPRVDGRVRVPAHLRERTPPVWLPTAPSPARSAPVEVEVEVAIPPPPSEMDQFFARLAQLDRLSGPPFDGVLPDPPTASDVMGLMVAKLSAAEFALIMRLLDVLTEDDFTSDAVRRNLRALEIIAAELRIQLGVPR